MSSSAFCQSSISASTVSVIQQPTLPADLYLCGTTDNATDPPQEGDNGGTQKASIEILEENYKELNSRKIKDSLSSFLPEMPGDFDSTESSETKLRHLLDQRVIGNKEFHLLSGHALLGFRLLPGPLPEQYRMDPPLHDSRTHHRKRKHKHKSLDKIGEDGTDLNPSSVKVKVPGDTYGFVKSESPSLIHSTPSPSTHVYVSPVERAMPTKVVTSGGHIYPQGMTASPALGTNPVVVGHDPISVFPGGKKKKEKKRNKEKKKEKKEKKKKKDKHHSQDLPVAPSGGPQPPPHPPPYTLQ